jgi:hypothetical protein
MLHGLETLGHIDRCSVPVERQRRPSAGRWVARQPSRSPADQGWVQVQRGLRLPRYSHVSRRLRPSAVARLPQGGKHFHGPGSHSSPAGPALNGPGDHFGDGGRCHEPDSSPAAETSALLDERSLRHVDWCPVTDPQLRRFASDAPLKPERAGLALSVCSERSQRSDPDARLGPRRCRAA